MASEVAICNRALGHIGHSAVIASLTENSNAAKRCDQAYAINRDMLLEKRDWTFARRFVTLALAGTSPEYWEHSYAYPSDCVKIQWLFDEGFDRQTDSRVPYEVALADDGVTRLIYTNIENAQLRYTSNVTNPALFPAWFSTCLSYMVAAEIAPALTTSTDLGERMTQAAMRAYGKAASTDGNENEEIYDWWTASWIGARA